RSASTSACAVGSPSASRALCPSPTTAPSGPTTTAPTGTSPAPRARRARTSARRITSTSRAEGCIAPSWPVPHRYRERMRVHVVDHPLVAHKLTVLRDAETQSPTFRLLVDELVTLLAFAAARYVATEPQQSNKDRPTTVTCMTV